jgi:hypothetical protein
MMTSETFAQGAAARPWARMHTMGRPLWLVGVGLLLCATEGHAATTILQWNPNQEPDLAGYKFYHHAGGTCPSGPLPPLLVAGKQVILPKDATQYTHIAGTVNGQYCYELTAFDLAGNESGRSNRAIKTVVIDATPPAAPSLRLGGSTTVKP